MGKIAGAVDIFIEHELSYDPLETSIIPLLSSQRGDIQYGVNENVGNFLKREDESEQSDDSEDEVDRPKEDDKPERSEDEAPKEDEAPADDNVAGERDDNLVNEEDNDLDCCYLLW